MTKLKYIRIEWGPELSSAYAKQGVLTDFVIAKAVVDVSITGGGSNVPQVITSGYYRNIRADISTAERKRIEQQQILKLKSVLRTLAVPTIRFADLADNAEGHTQ